MTTLVQTRSTEPAGTGPGLPGVARQAVPLVAVLLVAASLRPALTSVGPLLATIGTDTGLGPASLGLLGALPVLGFALVSPFVQLPRRRLGTERLMLLALAVLAAGILLRSLPAAAALWAGTALIGAAIAVGNVLLPSILKRDHAARISALTGAYSFTLGAAAAIASGLAVPLTALLLGNWRLALALWAVPVLVTLLVWRRATAGAAPEPAAIVPAGTRPLWRSAAAWQVTGFMGLQSTTFYLLITWLPTMEASRGISAAATGWHLVLFQGAGIVSGLGVSAVMQRSNGQRLLAVLISLAMGTAALGALLDPALVLLWVALAGVSSGSALVVALSLIGLRSRSTAQTAKLSGMAQAFGYLLAAGGPAAAGWLRDGTGSWGPVLGLLATLAAVQAVVALFAGRNTPVG